MENRSGNKKLRVVLSLILLMLLPSLSRAAVSDNKEAESLQFSISFSESVCPESLDGRVMLIISKDGSREPRFQVGYGLETQEIFGVDIEALSPGKQAVIDGTTFGYPLKSLSLIPPGEYWVQAVLHRYETFTRADGHTVKLPMDRGEGQQWNRAPGNLYSTPRKIRIDPHEKNVIAILLDRKMGPIEVPKDTKYIKHISIQSKLLTDFWGRPMHLGAVLLLPEGFEEHPEAHYPLVINHGHFNLTFPIFRDTPPASDLKGLRKMYAEAGYQLYKDWSSDKFPRVIIAIIQHANPYYDDSYAVNSENLGPYGDAITYELIPYIEKNFRGIGQGWARALYGGSTGGWEALAVQIFYPDEYNGTWAFCPDPVDFRAFQTINIYDDKNAYYPESPWKKTKRPGIRNYLGHVFATIEEMSHCELAMGTKHRSGQQLDIFQTVFGPMGEDGYPKSLWDPLTGEIDHSVAEYWREHYDLTYILRRDWKKLGPSLKGKIHIFIGDMDTYYLNDAVYLLEEFLKSTSDPYYYGQVVYGDRFEHCWSGDPNNPNSKAFGTIIPRFIPVIVKRMLETAPSGADVSSWRY